MLSATRQIAYANRVGVGDVAIGHAHEGRRRLCIRVVFQRMVLLNSPSSSRGQRGGSSVGGNGGRVSRGGTLPRGRALVSVFVSVDGQILPYALVVRHGWGAALVCATHDTTGRLLAARWVFSSGQCSRPGHEVGSRSSPP